MRVAHFNTLITGGAAIAARRLHDSLVQGGLDSRFYFRDGLPPEASYANAFPRRPPHWTALLRKLQQRYVVDPSFWDKPAGYEPFSLAWLQGQTPLQQLGPLPALVHLHWVANFIDYPSFFASIPDDIPIVWTLHDMNPFTGGCHYAWECRKYEQGCSACPQLGSLGHFDLAARNARHKARAFAGKNLHVVADSHWLETEARKSALFAGARSYQTIHYGLDTECFSPRDKAACRAALGVDAKALVIAFGADDVANRRKGLPQLLQALEGINTPQELVLLVFGRNPGPAAKLGRFTVKAMGPVSNMDTMASIYSAADIFVIPSLHEAFGQTCLEAMACGAPVLGFETGGIPDMVTHGKTGLLARAGDVCDLKIQLQWLLDHEAERKHMGQAARQRVERDFGLQVQAGRYLALYESLLQPRPAAA